MPQTQDDLASLEAKLQDAREELEQQRAEARKERARRLLEAQLAAIPHVSEAELKWGLDGVATVETPMGPIVLRTPASEAHWRRYSEIEAPKEQDFRKLVDYCTVWPPKDQLAGILTQYPGKLIECMQQILALVGIRVSKIEGK